MYHPRDNKLCVCQRVPWRHSSLVPWKSTCNVKRKYVQVKVISQDEYEKNANAWSGMWDCIMLDKIYNTYWLYKINELLDIYNTNCLLRNWCRQSKHVLLFTLVRIYLNYVELVCNVDYVSCCWNVCCSSKHCISLVWKSAKLLSKCLVIRKWIYINDLSSSLLSK